MQCLPYDLYSNFFREFEVSLALTAELRDSSAQLRHRVFAEECGFEPICVTRREQDAYDEKSLHCLIVHRRSGIAAGGIRLILRDTASQLAMEEVCANGIDEEHLEKLESEAEQVCEVSRFLVDPRFRNAARDGALQIEAGQVTLLTSSERKCFSLISTVAMLASLAMAQNNNKRWMFSVMESRTQRLIRRTTGVLFLSAGDQVEYRGLRRPFCASSAQAAVELRPEVVPYHQFLRSTLIAPSPVLPCFNPEPLHLQACRL
ncbi:MAG: PEP-CTERM/exosortase system-associated acyltransferase [Pseudomonadota bacterium]